MSDVVALRAFVPAGDFAASLAFYAALGFAVEPWGDGLACVTLGAFAFLLQAFSAEGFAGNFMMQLVVGDPDAWWERLDGTDLVARFGVRAPVAPALQPWGQRVGYVWDPSGVLWHVVAG